MKIALEPFSEKHLDATHRWMNDPAIAGPFLFSRRISHQEHRKWFESLEPDVSQQIFAIECEGNGHVGNIGLKNINRIHNSAELWMYVGETALHRRGIGTAALKLFLQIAFMQVGVRKITAAVRSDNPAAIAVYTKCGFSTEATLGEDMWFAGAYRDIVRMAISRGSWASQTGCGPRAAFMQPAFLPWPGFFELVDAVDVFVVLDDFQFSRQNRGQRNRMFLSPERPGWVSVPIQHAHDLSSRFVDVKENEQDKWRKRLLASMRQTYAKAPYRDEVLEILEKWLSQNYPHIAALNTRLIVDIARYLSISTPVKLSSSFSVSDQKRSRRVLGLIEAVGAKHYYSARGSFGYMKEDGVFPVERIAVYFQNFMLRPYRQCCSKDFVPNLSIVDALFNLSPDQVRGLVRGTVRWETWEEMKAAAQDSATEDLQPDA